MRRGTTCTVLPDREGRVSDPPLQMESGTVGRGLAPAAVFRSAKNRSPTAWAITPPDPPGHPPRERGGKFAARFRSFTKSLWYLLKNCAIMV